MTTPGGKRLVRRRHRAGSRGQVLVLYAVALVVVLGLVGVALDGSFGLVQARRAQNAADFASVSASRMLRGMCEQGQLPPSDQQVAAAIQDVINANSSDVGGAWTATYLDGKGQSTGVGISPTSSSYPPPNACGASVTVTPKWHTFLAGMFGQPTLTTVASASSANAPAQGEQASIVSLDKAGPHAVLGGGSGTFVVAGDIYLNTETMNDPWTQNRQNRGFDDAVDAKDSSNLYVYGTVHAPNFTDKKVGKPQFPMDWCFGVNGMPPVNTGGGPVPVYNAGQTPQQNVTSNPPALSGKCTVENPTFDYNAIDTTWSPISDPLGGASDPLDPYSNPSAGLCPGQSAAPVYTTSPTSGLLQPGDYKQPVVITGSAQFADCSGTLDTTFSGWPGVYRFEQGLYLDPGANQTVVGDNVTITVDNPLAIPGNVPGNIVGGKFVASGSGNGAPCMPAGAQTSTNGALVDSASPACAGTANRYGVIGRNQSSFAVTPSMDGSGTNFSLIIGGAAGSSVNLYAPHYGAYSNLLLFQHSTTPANFGFDAEPGDQAKVNLNGLVYNASLPNYGTSAPQYYWDTGIPYYNGGTLQTGYGTGGPGQPAASTASSSVTVNGIVLVDDFNTDGATTIAIIGQPYNFPAGGSGPTLTG